MAKDIINQQQRERGVSENVQTNVEAVTQAVAQLTNGCEKHPDNELKYYCEDDDTVVCGDCALADHYRHGILPVGTVAKSYREKIGNAIVKTLAKANVFKEAVARKAIIEFEDSRIRTATINTIERQAHHICTLINERKETLISEVNSDYDIRKKQNEANKDILELHHASLQSACGFAQQLVANGTDSDIMAHAKSLTNKLTTMENIPVPTPDTTAEISYSPGEISTAGLEAMLGQVTVQTIPPSAPNRFLREGRMRSGHLLNIIRLTMCEYPTFVTVSRANDNIVISDLGNCVHMLSPTGDQLYK
ncbi:tripartite motif-containing protein 3-like [Lingula anatina]|uniref:Tripartite motif-containing protein 3-like n=1 Tax=Lingula anatina TaxID=7574 RepID=A0A1S3IYS9_LINAN|nr:tripartite motif-containing protein 3-like [Lingula anatina]|eukprot:XP_013402704.1 tripartite motif-containing protein 3-like [Lingula anatina]